MNETRALQEGRYFDRYDLLENLREPRRAGRSFFALDRTTGEPLVVQGVPHLEAASTLFQNSYRLARMSNIPGLPPLLGGGVSEDRAYLASSWVPGPSIGDLLRYAPPPPNLALGLVWNLARVLSHLHGQRLFHGDIHPENIRIDPRGRIFLGGYFPAPYGAPGTRARDTDKVLRYLPPEAYQGAAADPAADVFALGLVIYELFLHRPLIGPGTLAQVRAKVASIDKRLEVGLPDQGTLGEGLAPVLRRMLHPDPDKRPKNGSEVLGLLLDVVPVSEPEESQEKLARLAARAMPALCKQTWRVAHDALARGRLPRATGALWRYTQLSPPEDKRLVRKGYELLTELFWAAKIQSDIRVQDFHPALFYVLHRIGTRWSLRTISRLAAESCHRISPDDNLLPAFLPEDPFDEEARKAEVQKHCSNLRRKVRAPKSLLALAVLTPGFHVEAGESPPRYSSRLLESHGLTEEALFYRAQELPHVEDRRTIVEDLDRLVTAAKKRLKTEMAAGLDPSVPPPPPEDLTEEDVGEDEMERVREVFAGLPSLPPARPEVDEDPPAAEGEALGSVRESDPVNPDLGSAAEDSGVDDSGVGDSPLVSPGDSDPVTPKDRKVPEELGPVPGAPLPSQPPPRPPAADGGGPLTLEDAAILFSRGQMLLMDDDLEEAGEIFLRIMEGGALEREHFHASILAELRKLIWKSITCPDPKETHDLIQRTWDLVHKLRLRELHPVCDRVLLRAVPEEVQEGLVRALLKHHPSSIILRQAAARHALVRNDRRLWAKHLVASSQILVARRQLFDASKLMMAARTALPDEELAPTRAKIFKLAERLAQAGVAFHRLESELEAMTPLEAIHELTAFLERHPHFGPAQHLLLLCAAEGDMPQSASAILMEDGRRALVRDDLEGATEAFRQVLSVEFENDEAMLYLASIQPEDTPWPENPRHLRPFLLERCELLEAAFHNALKNLRGGDEDRPLLELLVRLSPRLGRDGSRHSLALSVFELNRGNMDAARMLCRQAIKDTTDTELLASSLLRVPGIEKLLEPEDIQRMMAYRRG